MTPAGCVVFGFECGSVEDPLHAVTPSSKAAPAESDHGLLTRMLKPPEIAFQDLPNGAA